MNKWIIRLFVALMTFILSVALTGALRFVFGGWVTDVVLQSPPPVIDFYGDDQRQISAIYSLYGPAQTHHDRAFFERVEADNFVLFVGGEQLTREQDIQWLERQPTDTTYQVYVYYLNVFSDTAMSRGYMSVKYGNGETAEWPFIDVWVKRDGTWLIQSTTSSQ